MNITADFCLGLKIRQSLVLSARTSGITRKSWTDNTNFIDACYTSSAVPKGEIEVWINLNLWHKTPRYFTSLYPPYPWPEQDLNYRLNYDNESPTITYTQRHCALYTELVLWKSPFFFLLFRSKKILCEILFLC